MNPRPTKLGKSPFVKGGIAKSKPAGIGVSGKGRKVVGKGVGSTKQTAGGAKKEKMLSDFEKRMAMDKRKVRRRRRSSLDKGNRSRKKVDLGKAKTKAQEAARKKALLPVEYEAQSLEERAANIGNAIYGGVADFLYKASGGQEKDLKNRLEEIEQGIESGERVLKNLTKDNKKSGKTSEKSKDQRKVKASIARLRLEAERMYKQHSDLIRRGDRVKVQQALVGTAGSVITQLSKTVKTTTQMGGAGAPVQESFFKIFPHVAAEGALFSTKATAFGVSAAFMPGAISKFRNDRKKVLELEQIEKDLMKWSPPDKEMLALVRFMKNRHYIWSDLANLVAAVPNIVLNFLLSSVISLIDITGVTKHVPTSLLTGGMGRTFSLTAGYLAMTVNIITAVYKFGYQYWEGSWISYWKEMVEETEAGFKGKHSDEYNKLAQQVRAEATALGERTSLSDDVVANRVRMKATMGLMEKDRAAAAYIMLLKLREKGPLSLDISIMLGPFMDISVLKELMHLDMENEDDVNLGCDIIVEMLGM